MDEINEEQIVCLDVGTRKFARLKSAVVIRAAKFSGQAFGSASGRFAPAGSVP